MQGRREQFSYQRKMTCFGFGFSVFRRLHPDIFCQTFWCLGNRKPGLRLESGRICEMDELVFCHHLATTCDLEDSIVATSTFLRT
jgi:hypothetical protein